MRDYFNSLNEREKWMVIAGGICLIIFIYYSMMYAPLSNAVKVRSDLLKEQSETLVWMKKIKEQGLTTQNKQTVNNSQLLTLFSTQLKASQTIRAPFQLQQTSSGEVQLTFDEVPFKLFVTWLSKINDQYAFTIKQFDIDKTKTPGVTRLMIIIGSGN